MTKTVSKWRSVVSKLGLFIAVVVFPIASVSVLFSHNIHLPQSSAKQQDLTFPLLLSEFTFMESGKEQVESDRMGPKT